MKHARSGDITIHAHIQINTHTHTNTQTNTNKHTQKHKQTHTHDPTQLNNTPREKEVAVFGIPRACAVHEAAVGRHAVIEPRYSAHIHPVSRTCQGAWGARIGGGNVSAGGSRGVCI
jgi:hypothetical protein